MCMQLSLHVVSGRLPSVLWQWQWWTDIKNYRHPAGKNITSASLNANVNTSARSNESETIEKPSLEVAPTTFRLVLLIQITFSNLDLLFNRRNETAFYFQPKKNIFILWPWTLIRDHIEHHSDMVKMNNDTKYLHQGPFRLKVTTQTHKQRTDCTIPGLQSDRWNLTRFWTSGT